jgi:excisionase family DNA binding protein
MNQDELSVKETAELVGVSKTTIYRLCKHGNFPNHSRRDDQIWIPRRDVDAYLQRQQQGEMGDQEPPTTEIEAAAPPPPTIREPAEIAPLETPPVEEVQPESVPEVLQAEVEPPTPAPTSPSQTQVAPTPSPAKEPQWMETLQRNTYLLKRELVCAGIIGSRWLELGFRKIREKLERYQARAFPVGPKTPDSPKPLERE